MTKIYEFGHRDEGTYAERIYRGRIKTNKTGAYPCRDTPEQGAWSAENVR